MVRGRIAQLVGGELKTDKFVIGQGVVERIDDPFAVFVCVWIKEFRVLADLMCLVLRVAREREPKTGHALAEGGRGNETVDKARISVGTFVIEECVDLSRRRGE